MNHKAGRCRCVMLEFSTDVSASVEISVQPVAISVRIPAMPADLLGKPVVYYSRGGAASGRNRDCRHRCSREKKATRRDESNSKD